VNLRLLTWHEFVALAGGALLALGLFLPWYQAKNSRTELNGVPGPGDFTGWEVHPTMGWLLLAAAAAPFILAYIIVRGHTLSWARGEMTAVVAIAALGLVGYTGIVDRPGTVSGLVGIKFGWVVAMLGVLLMLGGSALRASGVERARKPPGVL
jgi:hypothetical protein